MDGRSHATLNTALFLAGVGVASLFLREDLHAYVREPSFAAFTLSYFAGTFFITPDLDLADRGVGPVRKWGPLGFIWVPYGAMHAHRGFSHGYLLGPLVRLVYLIAFFLPLALLFGLNLAELVERARPFILPSLLGYYLSQWGHLLGDRIPFRL